MLLVDLDGSLKHLPREGELYGNALKRSDELDLNGTPENGEHEAVKRLKEDLAWESTDVELVAEPETRKNDFQADLETMEVSHEKNYQLAETVDAWTDFLYARYHPRTVNVVKEYRHDAEKQSFDTHTCGVQLWKAEQFEDEFCDRIRQYIEECDFLQGFQTIFDAFNGFSGLATQCLEYLNDEYGNANLAVPVFMPKSVLCQNAGKLIGFKTLASVCLFTKALFFLFYAKV